MRTDIFLLLNEQKGKKALFPLNFSIFHEFSTQAITSNFLTRQPASVILLAIFQNYVSIQETNFTKK